jgi:hypothetical protein
MEAIDEIDLSQRWREVALAVVDRYKEATGKDILPTDGNEMSELIDKLADAAQVAGEQEGLVVTAGPALRKAGNTKGDCLG